MDTKELPDEALSLPAEGRAALTARLIESLDNAVGPDAGVIWAEEIARRSREVGAQTIPWATVRASILGR